MKYLCRLTGHLVGRAPFNGSEAGSHYNFTDVVSGARVYSWTCRCGHHFMATGRWSVFTVPLRRPFPDART